MKKKKKYITVANVLACLAVVFLHFNVTYWTFGYDSGWISANVIESLFYFAVPMFFMISGANLIGYQKRYSTKIYLQKRILRTVIPFLFWSMIGYIYQVHYGRIILSELNIKRVISDIFGSQIIGIYWFFIPLFAVYLCIPLLGAVEKQSEKKIFEYLITVALILNVGLPFLFQIFGMSYNEEMRVSVAGGYLFYAIVGYYIDHYSIEKKFRCFIYLLGVAGLLTLIIGTWKYSYRLGAIDSTFKGYVSLPCVCYSTAIFLFLKSADHTLVMEKLFRVCRPMSGATFGVYLMHWYILDWLITQRQYDPRSMKFRLVGGISVFLLTGCLTKILQRIPLLKRMIP